MKMLSRSQWMTASNDEKCLPHPQRSTSRSRVTASIGHAFVLLVYLAWLVPSAEGQTVSTTAAPTTKPGDSMAPPLSWITRSRLTHAQLDSLSLREGTSCPAVPYYRVVSLHDGPGAEVISVGRVVTPRAPVLLYGVPMYGSAGQSSFGRLYRKGHKLVVDAFAAEIFITVARSRTGNGAGIIVAKNGNTSTGAVVHHLSTLEITCRSTVFRVSCEARYIFTRPNTRLMEPTLVMIHPLEGRTTLPLNGISSVIASGLSSTAAVTLGSQIFEDLVNIEYLTMVLPADSYPCQRTEHWLRTIPAYVESAVLSGLASAVGGDTTSRSDLTPTVVAGRHLRVVKGPMVARTAVLAEDSPFSSSAGGSGSNSGSSTSSASATTTAAPRATEPLSPAPPITAYTLYRYRINIEDTPPLSSNALKGVTWLLVAFIVLMMLSIAAMFISRRQYISSYRDTWTSPDGRRMIFGNTARPTPSSSLIPRGEGEEDDSASDDAGESSSSTSNEGDAEDDDEDESDA